MNNVKYLNIQFIIFYYQKTKYTLESRRMNQNRADLLDRDSSKTKRKLERVAIITQKYHFDVSYFPCNFRVSPLSLPPSEKKNKS